MKRFFFRPLIYSLCLGVFTPTYAADLFPNNPPAGLKQLNYKHQNHLQTNHVQVKPKALIWDAEDYYRMSYQLLSEIHLDKKFPPTPKAKYDRLVTLLKKATELGHVAAAHTLGILALNLNNTPDGHKIALKYFLFAAQGQHNQSQLALGQLFTDDSSPLYDLEQGFLFLTAAAEQGSINAQYALGMLYLHPDFSNYAPEKARIWLEKASIAGHSNAQYELALLYYEGLGTFRIDKTITAHWLKQAAALGNLDAMLFLGRMYFNGWGVFQNHAEALKWWLIIQQSAEQTSIRERNADLDAIKQAEKHITDTLPYISKTDIQAGRLAAYGWQLENKPQTAPLSPVSLFSTPPPNMPLNLHILNQLSPPALVTRKSSSSNQHNEQIIKPKISSPGYVSEKQQAVPKKSKNNLLAPHQIIVIE